MKNFTLALMVSLVPLSVAHGKCSEVVKAIANKSIELAIIVDQKTTGMKKTINEATEQSTKGIKAHKPSLEIPDLMSDLSKENGDLNHVNAVLRGKIEKLVKDNPKCFR